MKNTFALLLIILLLSAQTCRKSARLPETLFKHWVHSFEEDSAEAKVYRPSTYNFPLARGREGFEIKANQEIILYKIAPTDAPEKVNGKWTLTGENKIEIQLAAEKASYQMNILQVDEDILKIQQSTN